MGYCRYCLKEGWLVRTDKNRVCRSCNSTIQQDIANKLAQIKEALVYVRCCQDPIDQVKHCDTAIELAEKLLPYEKGRMAEVSPRPSSVLEMLRVKRAEAQTKLRPVVDGIRKGDSQSSRPRKNADSSHAISTPTSVPSRTADASPGSEWWAWDTSTQDGSNRISSHGTERDSRSTTRSAVDCYALIQPGGIRARLENISTGGLFLRTEQILPPGSQVRLIVSTQDGPVVAEGRVCWSRTRAVKPDAPQARGMGIEFTEISPELAYYLAAHFNIPIPRHDVGAVSSRQ